MTILSVILLLFSILLSTIRNISLKSISDVPVNTKTFYIFQAIILLSGSIIIAIANGLKSISPTTVLYALFYGLLLIMAQWNYTFALKTGKVGVCAIVYAMGFIIPTLLGFLVWGETVTVLKTIGIILVFPTIILSGKKSDKTKGSNKYLIPLLLAMMASGGLGIVQKIHQSTEYANELTGLVFVAFLIAGVISLIAAGFAKKQETPTKKMQVGICIFTGLCFSISNLLNTKLTGLLDSSVFFPVANIGNILFSVFASFILFKERLNKQVITVLILGFSAILLINMG